VSRARKTHAQLAPAAAAVVDGGFRGSADRRSLLDRAHRGDIEGALGRVASFDTEPRRSARRRLVTLLAIMGPGLVVMMADDDAGSLSVFAQAGQDQGLKLLWLLLLLIPVLLVNQEMVARLGAVTGAGHARLIFERFGRRWGAFAVGDLFALNLFTIVTELAGVSLALGYFGISSYISVPLAAGALIAVTVGGSFRRWERAMYVLIAANLLIVPLVLLAHARPSTITPGHLGVLPKGVHESSLFFIIALVGTTIAPWQLFFQQSNVVDKRITSRWLGYERADTLVGTVVFALGAVAVLVVCAYAFRGSPLHGRFVDAGSIATGLQSRLGSPAGALFALALFNASILGAGVVTLCTSYTVGDVYGVRHSLHRGWRDARTFHGSFAALVILAAGVVLVPHLPLGVITTAVQALAGVLLPSATVFLLLLCNDRAVLGPRTNPPWLNAIASIVVGVLVALSMLLTITTLFPDIPVEPAGFAVGALLGFGLAVMALYTRRGRPQGDELSGLRGWPRQTWTMPALESLPPRAPSAIATVGLVVLRVYLSIAAVALVVRVVELAAGG